MPKYVTAGANNAPGTANTFFRIATTASQRVNYLGHWIAVESTPLATVTRLQVERTTGGTVTTTNVPEKTDIDSPAAAATIATSLSADPTVSGQPLIAVSGRETSFPRNAWHWWAHPRFPIVVDVSAFLSMINRSGGSHVDNEDTTMFFSEYERSPARSVRGRRSSERGYFHIQQMNTGMPGSATNPTRVHPQEFTMIDVDGWVQPSARPNTAPLFLQPDERYQTRVTRMPGGMF